MGRRIRYASDLATPWVLVAFAFGLLLGLIIFGLLALDPVRLRDVLYVI